MEGSAKKRRAPSSASTAEEAALVRSINSAVKKGESKFCCGGSFKAPEQGIRIWYSRDEETQELLRLPTDAYDDQGIEELVAASTAAEGDDLQLVHELLPASFATNFDLGQMFILDEIQRLLAPGVTLRAQLHKLVVIETGGQVKQKQVAASGEDELGYLNVTLPVPFTGGVVQLTSCAERRLHSFSWGGEPLDSLYWAAFLSGSCELGITEVTSGYMVQLSYKLFKLSGSNKRKRVLGVSDTVVDPHTFPLYELWVEAVSSDKFCVDGCLLGFACQHQYTLKSEEQQRQQQQRYKEMHRDEKPWLLKGADAMLFAAARAAGLKVELRPIYKNTRSDNPALLYIGKVLGEKAPGFLGEFSAEFDELDMDTLAIEELPTMREGIRTDVEVSWCLRNFAWSLGVRDKEEVTEVPWFSSTALLVTVPSWAERSAARLGSEAEMSAAKRNKAMEEAIALWFKRAEERHFREVEDADYSCLKENEEDDDEEDDDDDDDEEDEEEDDEDDDEDEDEEDAAGNLSKQDAKGAGGVDAVKGGSGADVKGGGGVDLVKGNAGVDVSKEEQNGGG